MPADIISPHNPRIKDAAKLRDRRGRERQQRIIIDGARELTRAIHAGVQLLEVFFRENDVAHEPIRAVLELAHSVGADVLSVSSSVFEKLAFGERTSSVVGIANTPTGSLDELTISDTAITPSAGTRAARANTIVARKPSLVLPRDPLVAMVEGVEKPGNLGAILRSADAAGVHAVIVADGGTDLYNPNTIRASLGTLFTLPVRAASSHNVLAWLRRFHFKLFAAQVNAKLEYTAADFRGPVALLFGAEDRGLSDSWSAPHITGIRLPMHGVADSLNVSATAAVLFYEALRQRSAARK